VAIHKIKPSAVADLIDLPGRHADGGGLYLQVAAPGQASWVFRHKEKWRSLGPATLYSIEEVRDRAHALRRARHEGQDPLQMLSAGRAAPAGKTFANAMADYLKAKSPTWQASNRDRELRRYAFLFGQVPDFTALSLASIDQAAKNAALATWETGSKKQSDVGFYIEAIIRYAETGKLLRVKKSSGGDDVEHHAAMPWRELPAFFRRLGTVGTLDSRALAFTILTGSRTDEVIGTKRKGKWTKHPASWREIGEEDGKPVWIIGGDRMKAGRKHSVPLTPQMVALLGKRQADDVPLFKVSSASAMLDTLRAITGNGYTVHGFRSSFEVWGAEATSFPRDLVKLCTAHDSRTQTDKAYQRSDLLEKRREIMQGWSDFIVSAS
jgi:integrase